MFLSLIKPVSKYGRHSFYAQISLPQCIYRIQTTITRGDKIFNHHYCFANSDITLNQILQAVSFLFASHIDKWQPHLLSNNGANPYSAGSYPCNDINRSEFIFDYSYKIIPEQGPYCLVREGFAVIAIDRRFPSR